MVILCVHLVVDESNRPVGIIDSQDLTKVKLL